MVCARPNCTNQPEPQQGSIPTSGTFRFCQQHKCRKFTCPNERETTAQGRALSWCLDHKCWYQSCDLPSVTNNNATSKGCHLHKCQVVGCGFVRCHENTPHCNLHDCIKFGCERVKLQSSEACAVHTCHFSRHGNGLSHPSSASEQQPCTRQVQDAPGSTSCAQHACSASVSCAQPYWSDVSRHCLTHQCRRGLEAESSVVGRSRLVCRDEAQVPSLFCEQHKCRAGPTDCLNEVGDLAGDRFCEDHQCQSFGCRFGCPWRTGAYCWDHGCRHYSRRTGEYCADERVLPRQMHAGRGVMRTRDGVFCTRHTCSVDGCFQEKGEGTVSPAQRCNDHICAWDADGASCEQGVERQGWWCRYHRCSTRGCGGARVYDSKYGTPGRHCGAHTCLLVDCCRENLLGEVGSPYCEEHTCSSISGRFRCRTMVDLPGPFCHDHRCKIRWCMCARSSTGGDFCPDHKCAEPGCLGPRGAWGGDTVRCSYHVGENEKRIAERLRKERTPSPPPQLLPSEEVAGGETSWNPSGVSLIDSNNYLLADPASQPTVENAVYYGHGYQDGFHRGLQLSEAEQSAAKNRWKYKPEAKNSELRSTMGKLADDSVREALKVEQRKQTKKVLPKRKSRGFWDSVCR
ncbi:hypothetical protein V8F33_009109 [Rhypophila sp. PSN 637]